MKVAIIPHVGSAKGHLLRAIAIHRALLESAEFDSLLIVPERARVFMQEFFPDISCKWVNWGFEHSNMLVVARTIRQIRIVGRDLEETFNLFTPNLIIGIPGFESSSICRTFGVPHVSVLHGPWLIPEYVLAPVDEEERAVLDAWERAIKLTDFGLKAVASVLGKKYRSYPDWLEKENVWVAQDFNVEYKNSRPKVGFLHADFGPLADGELPTDCLTVCLGTAIESDKMRLLNALSEENMPRLAVGGSEVHEVGIYWRPTLAATSMANISRVALTHGGIGTLAIFAEARVPQIFLPHDLDQAVNAMLAQRSGFGTPIHLRYWKRRSPFGRKTPPFVDEELRQLVRRVANELSPKVSAFDSIGAIQALAKEACAK